MHLASYETELYEEFAEYRVYKWIHWFGSPFLFLLGTCGNALLIWLLLPNCRATATYKYLVVLGLVDQLVLTSGLLNRWLQQAFGFSIELQCHACCLVNKFASYFSSYSSAMLISVVSFERALVICFPLKAVSLQSSKRMRLVMLGILAFSALINSYWFFILDRLPDSAQNATVLYASCDIKPIAQHLSGPISVLDAVLYSILPLLVIFSCNIVTICKLRRARLRRQLRLNASQGCQAWKRQSCAASNSGGQQPGKPGSSGQQQQQENVRQVTILLLSISTFYLVASLPVALLKVLTTLSNAIDLSALSENRHSYAQYRLVEAVTHLCMFSNHCVNFALYCASGQRIRNELRARLRQACCRCGGGGGGGGVGGGPGNGSATVATFALNGRTSGGASGSSVSTKRQQDINLVAYSELRQSDQLPTPDIEP